MKFTIIIPSCVHYEENLRKCLVSIVQNTDLTDGMINISLNGYSLQEVDNIEADIKNDSILGAYRNKIGICHRPNERIGYPRAINEGLRCSSTYDEVRILLNDDTIVESGWLEMLLKPFDDPEVGITGPVKFSFRLGGNKYEAMAFWCVAIRAKLFLEIGFLDEAFSPGMGEDGDFSIKAQQRGYKLVAVPDDVAIEFGKPLDSINFPIYHKGNGTFGDDEQEKNRIIERNQKLLEERYGNTSVVQSEIDQIYDLCLIHQCDIHEHLPTLFSYAQHCEHITEFGVRGVFSTWSLLKARPKHYHGYDVELNPNIIGASHVAKNEGIDFQFHLQDVLTASIEETDLLFIDTHHTYAQLKEELRLHSKKVRKYIILHDTETFGGVDEAPIKEGEPITEKHGLLPAVGEFLVDNPEWFIVSNDKNNNGLMAMQRIEKIEVSIVIPTFNHLEDCLKPCIESILRNTDMGRVEIVVSANGCTDGTREYLSALQAQGEFNLEIVWSDESIGFTKATNRGIEASHGKYILLMNNDVEVQDYWKRNEWLEKLKAPLEADPTVKMSGPLKLHDFYSNVDFIVFFCAFIDAEMFAELGLLDEIYSPGGGEDIEFAARLQQAGYGFVQVDKTKYNGQTNVGEFPIWHKDNRTFTEIPEYTRKIIKDNGLRNLQRYNKNVKLNLGSGGIQLDGYVSVDLYDERAHIIYDITKLSEIIPPGVVEEILAIHVFEHLNPYDSMETLKGWLGLLKSGGKLIMEMPNIEELCKRFVNATIGERYGILNAVYGSVNTAADGFENPSKITSPHLFGWWPESIGSHLYHAGYTDIKIMPEQFPHPESNFRVEATKP